MSSRNSVFVIFIILLISNVMVYIPNLDNSPIGSSSGAAPPAIEHAVTYWDGDWLVDTNATYRNQTIIINGSITIASGNILNLINITLKFNGAGNLSRSILVNSSAGLIIQDYDNNPLTINDRSIITSNQTDGKHRFGFCVRSGANFTMINSELSECGKPSGLASEWGLYLRTNNAVIRDCNILNCYSGIIISDCSNSLIENNTFSNIPNCGLYITSASRLSICNNTIDMKDINSDGIWLTGSKGTSIIGNTIRCHRALSNCIFLSTTCRGTDIISNNLNCSAANTRALYVQSDHVNITSNRIGCYDSNYCVDLEKVDRVDLTDNIIHGRDVIAVLSIDGSQNITVNGGNITGVSCRPVLIDNGACNVTFESVNVHSNGPSEAIGFIKVKDVLLVNSSMTGTTRGLCIYAGSQIIAINCVWTNEQFFEDTATLTEQYYLDISVVDILGDPITGANVTIKSKTDKLVFNRSVDPDGKLSGICLTEGVHNLTTSIMHTPHNVTITALGYHTWSAKTMMDRSRLLYAMLLKPGEKKTIHYKSDWDVNGTEEYWNETFLMDGNITVDFGETLILNNCTVMMNCSQGNGQYHIEVRTGGTLQILDYDGDHMSQNDVSLITDSPYDVDDGSYYDFAYNFSVASGGSMEARNSIIRDCGWAAADDCRQGISVNGDDLLFDHVNISNRFKGIVINGGSSGKISNCTLTINATSAGAVGIQGWDRSGLSILDNNVNMTGTGGSQVGISLDNNTGSTIDNNYVTLTSSTGWADGISLIGGTDNYIKENVVNQYIHGTSIILWGTSEAKILSNVVLVSADWSSAILNFASTNSVIMDNYVYQAGMGVGIAVQQDCAGTVVYDNCVLGVSNMVYALYVHNAYNNFQIINNTVNLTGPNSHGLRAEGSTEFGVYGLNVTISNQSSIGLSFMNSNNATVIGANITTSAAATHAHGVWIQQSGDIYIVNLEVTLNNALGAGLLLTSGANNSYVASAYITTTSSSSPAVEGYNCTGIFIINSTLNAQTTVDALANQNATLVLLNSTFVETYVLGSTTQIIVGWFLHVQVLDCLGKPVAAAKVQIKQSDGTVVCSSQTDAKGWLKWLPLLGYIKDENTVDNSSNPYSINASNATCWDLKIVDMTNNSQTIIINLVNDEPVIKNPMVSINVLEDTVKYIDFDATDFEYNPVSWSITPTRSWAALDPITGELTLTPNDDHVGNHIFTIKVTDINSGYDSFDVTVTVKNRPPVFITTNDYYAQEDVLYSTDLDTDDDPETKWSIYNCPTWLSFNADQGTLTGTPKNSEVGTWMINISVSDNHGGVTWNNYTLMVNNTLPEILTSSLPDAMEDKLYKANLASTDDGYTGVVWSLKVGPSWLSIDPWTGELSGTPRNDHVKQWLVTIEVHDGNGGRNERSFNLTVINNPPKILTNDDLWADEDEKYKVDYSCTDDGYGTIIWSLNTNTVDWLSIDKITGVLSGTPRNAHVGIYWVNVTVNDGNDGLGWHNFSLNVNNTNDAPVIISKNILTATEDILYEVTYKANDDDGDIVTWSLTTDASWLTMDSSSGVLSGTPTNNDIGTYIVIVICDDDNSGITSCTFNLTVVNVNDAPVIDSYKPLETYPAVEEGAKLEFNITYSDIDSTTLNIRWTLDGILVRSDVPFWTYQPEFTTAGDHEVMVNITDSGGASVQHRWIVIVTTANRAPIITEYYPMNLKPVLNQDSSKLTFGINASDPDMDPFEIKWFINGVDTGERTNVFILDRAVYRAGTYNLTVRVIDDKETATLQTWTVDVKPELEDKDAKNSETMDITIYIVLIIVVIIVVLLVVMFVLKKKGNSQIEDIFIISNSGILLAHKTKELRPDMDDNILSGMLTAIQDFIKDAFKDKTKFGLRRLDFGDSVIHLKRGKGFYVAVVLSGTEPKNLEVKLDKTIEKIDGKYGEVLRDWSGNINEVRGIKDELDLLLR